MGYLFKNKSDSDPNTEKVLLEDFDDAEDLKPAKLQSSTIPSRTSLLVPWSLCLILSVIIIVQSTVYASKGMVPFWTPSDFITIRKDFPTHQEQLRFDAGLRFDKNKDLYRVQHAGQVQYVGTPSDELDANWKELIGAINILITPLEAASLGHDLWHDPDTQLYMAQPTVFHDLHCLNMLRKNVRFYSEYYDEHKNVSAVRTHLDHCIDSLRLSLMCTGDMTMSPIIWSEEKGRIIPNFEVKHTCRDYESLKQWANNRGGGEGDNYLENAARLKALGKWAELSV